MEDKDDPFDHMHFRFQNNYLKDDFLIRFQCCRQWDLFAGVDAVFELGPVPSADKAGAVYNTRLAFQDFVTSVLKNIEFLCAKETFRICDLALHIRLTYVKEFVERTAQLKDLERKSGV